MKAFPAFLALILAALAFVPAAEAAETSSGPCLTGAMDCLVYVHWVVCVTEPCDPMMVCVGFGLVCTNG